MGFGGPGDPHEENGDAIEDLNEKVTRRICELRQWQDEQQKMLNQQHNQQIQQLKKEQKNIQQLFQRKSNQPEDCLSPTANSDKSDGTSVKPPAWNKLILPHSSPSERIKRADHLKELLKRADPNFSPVEMCPDVFHSTEAENEKIICILKEQERKTPNVPLSGMESNRNVVPDKPKFPFLRKGQSLSKFNVKIMKNPELCLGVRGVPKETSVGRNLTKLNLKTTKNPELCLGVSKDIRVGPKTNENPNVKTRVFVPLSQDVQSNIDGPILTGSNEGFQRLHSDLKSSFDGPTEIIRPKRIIASPKTTPTKTSCISSDGRSIDDQSLREFEFLERASEETSFDSTSSIVVHALQFNSIQPSKRGAVNDRPLANIAERGENEVDLVVNEDPKPSFAEINEGDLMKSSSPLLYSDKSSSVIEFRDEFSWNSADEDVSCCSNASLSLSRDDLSPPVLPISQAANFIPSKIVTRYFSRLKPGVEDRVPCSVSEEKNKNDINPNASTLDVKVKELEKEIERFRHENLALVATNNHQKRMQKQLEKEKNSFELYKQREQQRINSYLEGEKQKTRKERELYDLYLKTRPQFDRQERKQLTKLKKEVEDVKSALRDREMKWNVTQKRLQDRARTLEVENECLKTELQTVEQKNRELITKIQDSRVNSVMVNQDERVLVPRISKIVQSTPDNSSTSFWTDSPSEESLPDSSPEQLSYVDNTELFSLNPTLTLITASDKVLKTTVLEDGCVERLYESGTRELRYSNDTRKEISSDGKCVMVFLFNGDIKHILSDEKIVYYFAENQTTHTTYPDGLQVYHFANNQLEKHFPDGTKQITFPDRSVKFIFNDGSEESVLEDGTRVQTNANGDCVMQFPNGQKEVHTDKFKKRIFLDGTVKLLFPDGKQETRYANGRVRIKNKDGKLIVDQKPT